MEIVTAPAVPRGDQGVVETKAIRTCPICEATCGLELTLVGRSVKLVRGDRLDVLSAGYLCPKGASVGAIQDDPDRLVSPLVKRDGQLVETTWEEAFAEVDVRLSSIIERYGRDATAVYVGNSAAHSVSFHLYGSALPRALQTKNVYTSGSVDQIPRSLTSALIYGDVDTVPVPDIDRTDLLWIIGGDPIISNGSLWTVPNFPGRVKSLKERGGRLIVFDPRRSRTADEADEHIAIRPGTDALFLFAVVNAMVAQGATPSHRVAGMTDGLNEVLERARPFTVDRVAPVCGVESPTISRLATELLQAGRAAVYGRIGTCTQEFGTLTTWLIDVVNLLAGNLDEIGGAMFNSPAIVQANTRGQGPMGRGSQMGRWSSRVSGTPEVCGELPVKCLPEEILTPGVGQVRALFTLGANPALSNPDAGRINRALESLELLVAFDVYVNETTRHADVILPSPPWLTRPHYDVWSNHFAVRNTAKYTPPTVESYEDERSDHEILLRLASIAEGAGPNLDLISLEDAFLRSTIAHEVGLRGSVVHGRGVEELMEAIGGTGVERVLDFLLRVGPYGDGFGANSGGLTLATLAANPHGIDLGALEPRLPGALRTRSGKIELARPEIVADIPRLLRSMDRPRPPFVLIGRRDVRSSNSWLHNVEKLVRGKPRCTMQICPVDAEQLGLEDGGMAVVTSSTGAISVPVEITDRMVTGVVSIPHGWGHGGEGSKLGVALQHAGVNCNVLTDASIEDAVSGTTSMNGVPVQISRADPIEHASTGPSAQGSGTPH
jgi:anaerobic selenocysteine-containing dehydrogenase